MKHFIFWKSLLLLCALVVGSSSVWAVDTLVETLDLSDKSAKARGYTTTSVWNDNWTLYGGNNNNQDWAYVRFGGKAAKSGTATTGTAMIYTTTAIGQAIDYVTIEHLGVNGKKPADFSITSIVLETSASSNFSSPTTTTITTYDVASSTSTKSLTITPNSQVSANSYYRISINWSSTNTNNMGLDVEKVKLYQIASSDLTSFAFVNATPSTTLVKNGENDYSATYTQAVSFDPDDYTGTITYSIDDDNSTIGANTLADIDSGTGEVTVLASANESSTIVVKATGAADSKYNAPSAATYTLTVNAAIAYTINAVANNNAYGFVSVSGATITATPKGGYKVPATDGYTVSSGTATVVNNGDGTFTVTPTSDCTITINFEEKATPVFAFASNTASVTYGNDVTEPALTNEESTGDVTYTSSNEAVATVDATTGEVTAVAVGSTTITATVAEDANYKTANTSYTLTVNENTTASGASNLEVIFYESFNKCDGAGGNSGGNSGSSIATVEITSSIGGTSYTDNDGWTTSSKIYKADKCVKIGTGTSSSTGNITTPGIEFDSEKTYTLTFEGLQWSSDGKAITVGLDGDGTITAVGSPELGASSFATCTYTITGASNGDKITFSRNKRFFLDEVKVYVPSESYYITATIPASGWGTYCSPYKLDLSNDATEVTAYAVTGFNAEEGKITFTKVTGVVPAKTPLVIYGEAGSKKIAVDQTEATGTAPVGNLLTGYLSPTYYDGDRSENTVFALSGGNFHKLTAGTIKANKAVLSMSTTEANKVPVNSEGKFTFIFNDGNGTTNINALDSRLSTLDQNAPCYNMAGQRVNDSYKGIVIVNGKKYIKK